MEDRLPSIDEWLEEFALVELDALLVDVELHLVKYLADDISGVLQADGEALGVCCIGEEVEEVGAVSRSQANSVFVVVTVDVVGINCIAAFAGGKVNASGHDGSYVGSLGVEPPLACPTVHRAAFVGGLEVCLIWTPVLKTTCRKVTDDLLACSMESVDGGLRRVKEIKVENIGWVGCIRNNPRELDLPC